MEILAEAEESNAQYVLPLSRKMKFTVKRNYACLKLGSEVHFEYAGAGTRRGHRYAIESVNGMSE